MQKQLNKIVHFCLVLVVLTSTLMIGLFKNRYYAQNTNLPIAVVDQDTGINDEGKTIYYGKEFLKTINDKSMYKSVSLTEAKEGVENDIYCAYVVIPDNFSKNIESIKTTPTKSVVVYGLNNKSDINDTLNKLNTIVGSLDTNIAKGYLTTVLNNVNGVDNNISGIVNTIQNQNVVINGIQNFEYITTVELTASDTLVINDEMLKNALQQMTDIQPNLNNQLENSVLTNQNSSREKLFTNIKSLNIGLEQLESTKYYEVTIQQLDLIQNFVLKSKDDQPITILLDRSSGQLLVKNNNLIINNPNHSEVVGGTQGEYINIVDINNQIVKYVLDNNPTSLNILGNTLEIYGHNIGIDIYANKMQLRNATKVRLNNQYYYPDPNSGIIDVQINSSSINNPEIDKLKNDLQTQVNYNKLSASIIQELVSINNANPNTSVSDAINQITSNNDVNGYFQPFADIYNHQVINYINKVTPDFFSNIISTYIANETVVNSLVGNEYVASNIKFSITDNFPNVPLKYFETINTQKIEADSIFNLNETNKLASSLDPSLTNYESSIPKSINYQFITGLIKEIMSQVNNVIDNANSQIDNVNDKSLENYDKVTQYVSDTKESVINNTNAKVEQLINENNQNINDLNTNSQKFNYLKDGNVINTKLVDYMVSSIDLENQTTVRKNEEKDTDYTNIFIITGTLVGATALGIAIYYQTRKTQKGGD